jgi:hypothetical protein
MWRFRRSCRRLFDDFDVVVGEAVEVVDEAVAFADGGFDLPLDGRSRAVLALGMLDIERSFLFDECVVADFANFVFGRAHELADRIKDRRELLVVLRFQFVEAAREVGVRLFAHGVFRLQSGRQGDKS